MSCSRTSSRISASLTRRSITTGVSGDILGSGKGLGIHRKDMSLLPRAVNFKEFIEMLRRMFPRFVSARTNRLCLDFSPSSSPARGLMKRLPIPLSTKPPSFLKNNLHLLVKRASSSLIWVTSGLGGTYSSSSPVVLASSVVLEAPLAPQPRAEKPLVPPPKENPPGFEALPPKLFAPKVELMPPKVEAPKEKELPLLEVAVLDDCPPKVKTPLLVSVAEVDEAPDNSTLPIVVSFPKEKRPLLASVVDLFGSPAPDCKELKEELP